VLSLVLPSELSPTFLCARLGEFRISSGEYAGFGFGPVGSGEMPRVAFLAGDRAESFVDDGVLRVRHRFVRVV